MDICGINRHNKIIRTETLPAGLLKIRKLSQLITSPSLHLIIAARIKQSTDYSRIILMVLDPEQVPDSIRIY